METKQNCENHGTESCWVHIFVKKKKKKKTRKKKIFSLESIKFRRGRNVNGSGRWLTKETKHGWTKLHCTLMFTPKHQRQELTSNGKNPCRHFHIYCWIINYLNYRFGNLKNNSITRLLVYTVIFYIYLALSSNARTKAAENVSHSRIFPWLKTFLPPRANNS